MKPLPLFLLLPLWVSAQQVKPVISKDYLELIRKDSTPGKISADTTNSIKHAKFNSLSFYSGNNIRKITMKKGVLHFHPLHHKSLRFSGNFNSAIEARTINRLPELQKDFVQGRSQNGALIWRGPETGELFSYGPDINSLEFDGSNYAYDLNGRLVASGTGNGKKANAYDNNIFRTAILHSHSLLFQTRYMVGTRQALKTSLKLGKAYENIFIRNNKNQTENIAASIESFVKWLSITTNYTSIQDRFSNSNRNGFLNRIYLNSILSPVSFDNTQGNNIGSVQRSYGNEADNPFFLLDNQNSFLQTHKTGSIAVEKRSNRFRFKLTQSLERISQNNMEGYKAGTAFFPNGVLVNRNKTDKNYHFNANINYDIHHNFYRLSSTIYTNYNHSNNQTSIKYLPFAGDYNYRRSAHDLSFHYLLKFNGENKQTGLSFVNKSYISSTSNSKKFFLPSVSGYARFDHVFGLEQVQARIVSSFNNFTSELPVSRSFSQNNLLQYQTRQSLQYFPLIEVSGFDQLSLIRHKEWSGRVELSYRNKISLNGEVFVNNTEDDVFPVFENGQLILKNIAGHRSKGMELEVNVSTYQTKLSTFNKLSFFANRTRVTEVEAGYDRLPIAGFDNVHKAIVKGKALGVIVGNSFLRNANHNLLIGTDGFPLTDPTPVEIGDPNPDFVMKLTNAITWKKLHLNLDWEWKKGGDIWNGTQAVLDYYGRSKSTAQLRNTTGFIFPGVLPNGHPNDIPVKFYDPSLSVDQNLWTRYGHAGVAEEYIQKADLFKINNVGLSYSLGPKKFLRNLVFTLYAENLLIWTAYKGADPNQLLYDESGTNGLDFFNLPSIKTFGFNISVQF